MMKNPSYNLDQKSNHSVTNAVHLERMEECPFNHNKIGGPINTTSLICEWRKSI
jgi:hypothetical protein